MTLTAPAPARITGPPAPPTPTGGAGAGVRLLNQVAGSATTVLSIMLLAATIILLFVYSRFARLENLVPASK